MYIGTLDPVSNKTGWQLSFEVVDDETSDPIDLSASDIVFDVRDPECDVVKLSATTDNSKISIIDTGVFQIAFTASDMRQLCAMTYEVGCTIKNGAEEPVQFLIGRIPVLDGIVS